MCVCVCVCVVCACLSMYVRMCLYVPSTSRRSADNTILLECGIFLPCFCYLTCYVSVLPTRWRHSRDDFLFRQHLLALCADYFHKTSSIFELSNLNIATDNLFLHFNINKGALLRKAEKVKLTLLKCYLANIFLKIFSKMRVQMPPKS